ncbi:putative signal transducing protein [Chitinophaga japonensis]|uniref:Putative signal transducing protein n=1 Tax=Chitinophaga japonensis TaxID=104662 RepID=A0A562TDU2_CHIJA|nr:DUF2007 domain-containing protein [Chitinophaga japonensis]TWI91655.1 putative signal transducing protein [Chitinophaga japonensis]
MEKDWIKVFATDRPFEAEIVKGLLLENGINAVLLNRQDSSYVQALPGLAEVYVHVSQQAQALELIGERK